MKKGLSLLDFVNLNKGDDYSSLELIKLIKRYGSLERNISLHNNLLNHFIEMVKVTKGLDWQKNRPFQLLVDKIKEIEARIDQYISLMFESEINLPDHVHRYVRLVDLVRYFDNNDQKTEDPFKELEKENRILNNHIRTQNTIIKKLVRKTRYKLGDLDDAHIEIAVDTTRKKNGSINYTKAGKRLGVSRDTLRREIDKRNLLYLVNTPD